MNRRVRITLIIAAVPVVLAALLWGALLTVGNTGWGRQRIESLVGYLTADQVRLQGLGGDLPDRLTLRELQLADAHGVWLTALNLQLTWHPWALLGRRVVVQTGHVQHIDWLRLPVSQSRSTGKNRMPVIDVQEVSADAVQLSAALAGAPATLNVHGSAHLRTVTDMQLAFAATRLDGPGTYSVQWAFNESRMDGAFRLREPDHGPLAGLLGVPAIGAVQVSGDLAGLRQAEHITLQADVGELHAHATGVVDLVRQSADLEYAADASAMAPRPELSWQKMQLHGTWRGSLQAAVAAGELQLQGLALPSGLRVGLLNASYEAHGAGLSARARIAGVEAPGVPAGLLATPLLLEGSVQLAAAARPFELHASHPTFTLNAKGQAAGTRSVEADVEAGNVAPLLQAVPGGLSGPLRLHASVRQTGAQLQMRVTAGGNLDSSVAAWHTWLRGPETADIRATYQAPNLTFADSVVSNKALTVTASGRLSVARQDAPWAVVAKAKVGLADLSLLLPSLSGTASIRAEFSGNATALRTAGDLLADVAVRGSPSGAVRGSFDIRDLPQAPHALLHVQGSLAGEPVTVQAEVQVRPGQSVHIGLSQADWQSLHAQGDLTLAEDLDRSQGELKWSDANLADLNQLLGQHLGGRLTGELKLAPAGKGSDVAHTSLQIAAAGLEIGSQKLDATLTGSGPLHALQLSLAAQAPVLGKPATLAAQGHLDSQQRSLTVTAATAAVYGIDLQLQQPAVVNFAQGLALAGLHVSAADATLSASGEILPQLQLNAEFNDATPTLVNAILPGYLSAGKLKATVALQGTLQHPQGQLRVTGTDLRAAGDAASLPAAQLSANLDLDADGVRVALHSSTGATSHMVVEGSIPWSGPVAVTVSGVQDLARFNALLESGGLRIAGTAQIDARVAGTLAAPTVQGTVQLHGGAVHDYRHGIDLTAIEGALQGTQSELRITQLTAHAATGTLAATGTIGVLQGGWPVDLRFTARDAQPLASSIVSGNVNADLTLTGAALHELTLAGSVQINRATVEIPNKFPPNVAVLDVRRPGQVVTRTNSGPAVNLNLKVDATRQILVRGRGLEAELGGHVEIGGTARVPVITGGFDLQRGLFELAGSRLNFSSGRISFTGADITGKIDPTLDFTAQTSVQDTTVILRITGVADAPEFELTSVPQLPQDEILARLLFGESSGQLTALQAAELGAALMTLTGSGSGFNPLVDLQKHLGLDRLSVGTTDTGTAGSSQNSGATIEAGRYLTDRIFVDVRQNTTGATQLGVAVDLTSKLKFQTRISTATATVQGQDPNNDQGTNVGLSYRFEY